MAEEPPERPDLLEPRELADALMPEVMGECESAPAVGAEIPIAEEVVETTEDEEEYEEGDAEGEAEAEGGGADGPGIGAAVGLPVQEEAVQSEEAAQPLGAPGDPTISDVDHDGFTVSWDPVPGSSATVSYEVQRWQDGAGRKRMTTATSMAYSGLRPGSEQEIRVLAIDGHRSSPTVFSGIFTLPMPIALNALDGIAAFEEVERQRDGAVEEIPKAIASKSKAYLRRVLQTFANAAGAGAREVLNATIEVVIRYFYPK
jgi:hypothetical protein